MPAAMRREHAITRNTNPNNSSSSSRAQVSEKKSPARATVTVRASCMASSLLSARGAGLRLSEDGGSAEDGGGLLVGRGADDDRVADADQGEEFFQILLRHADAAVRGGL